MLKPPVSLLGVAGGDETTAEMYVSSSSLELVSLFPLGARDNASAVYKSFPGTCEIVKVCQPLYGSMPRDSSRPNLRFGQRRAKQRVFVVKDVQANLLGLPALITLKLLCPVDTVTKGTSEDNIIKHFPKVFEGLGNIGEEYTIQLKPNAMPYSLYTPRHVALPLREKVRDELN